MNVNGKPYHTIWLNEKDPRVAYAIDQTKLPHEFVIESLHQVDDFVRAICDMHMRGAILIGIAAAYGMYFAALAAPQNSHFEEALIASGEKLKATRPTAVNLAWAVDRQLAEIKKGKTIIEKIDISRKTALVIAEHENDSCRTIGEHGLQLIQEISRKKNGAVVNILTHCNAGWLACLDYGTATAPIYAAFNAGIPIHVWVDETRPWNQGARLTAWELGQHHVPHTVIADNTGGHLMQHGMVDFAIVGADRVTRTGDVANKIGTYLKALAARDNQVPFYVALPSSTFDWNMRDGVQEIPIEERGSEEVRTVQGLYAGKQVSVLITPDQSPVANYGFDVTPARLITGLISERGVCEASETEILRLFPEYKK